MRKTLAIVAVAIGFMMLGCAKPAGPVFPPLANPPVWPGGSEKPRVKYVGQLVTSADLKPAVGFGEGISNAIFGKKAIFSMLSPYAVCTDGADRLFVADSNAQLVHVFNLKTRKYERWTPDNPEKRFAMPVGLAWDPQGQGGRLFVSDSVAAKVYIFDSAGKQVGTTADGVFQRPAGLAYDPRTQRLYVADTAAHHVVILSPAGVPLVVLGSRGTRPGYFNFPTNVALDSQGRLYVSDSLNFRVQQYSPDYRMVRVIGKKGDMPGYFGQPKGVAVDSQDHLYVVDANFEAVQVFDSDGRLLMDFGSEGHKQGEFWLPAGVYIDRSNRIWIADTYNRRVQVFDYLPVTEGSS
jgi:DNA-binding beta-propeller fold protein YncE